MTSEFDWDEDDRKMEELNLDRWSHRLGHECGHATAAMHHKHYPDNILLGKMLDKKNRIHQGLAQNAVLPDDAPAEDQIVVMLAGEEAENLLFGRHDEGAERDMEIALPLIEVIRGRDGESRTAEKILADLRVRTREVLSHREAALRRLFEIGFKKAKEFGLLKLNLEHMEVVSQQELHDFFHQDDVK